MLREIEWIACAALWVSPSSEAICGRTPSVVAAAASPAA